MTASIDSDEHHLCTECVGNHQFAKWIRDNGRTGECDFDESHGSSNPVVTVVVFAEEVDRYFRETYQRGEEYAYATAESDNPSYATYGEPYRNILEGELECEEAVLDAIIENLPDCSAYDLAQGDDPFYDDGATYESFAVAERRSRAAEEEYWYENRFALQWDDFCKVVQFRNRFFKSKELLDSLFGKPEEYQEGTIRPIYQLKAGRKLIRARVLDDSFTQERLSQNPKGELGAPPKEKARPGRMNVEYIPSFYAAFSEEAAIAEVRPSIEDQVAVGEFALQTNITVFDFTAFSRIEGENWREAVSHTRYDFIEQMEREISKPIFPFEKQREYIPTQIVAEYLHEYFGCNAVIYRSSMHRNIGSDNRNIVIFNNGTDFVGDGASHMLMLSQFRIVTIGDVVYKIEEMFF